MRLFGKFFGQRPEPEHHGTPREIALSIVGPPPLPMQGSDRKAPSEERAARRDYNARLQAVENRQANLAASRASTRALRDYRAARVKRVAILAECCPTCDARAGKPYALDAVFPIPQPGCTGAICHCRYAPVCEVGVFDEGRTAGGKPGREWTRGRTE
jgi:hypothetical protein